MYFELKNKIFRVIYKTVKLNSKAHLRTVLGARTKITCRNKQNNNIKSKLKELTRVEMNIQE